MEDIHSYTEIINRIDQLLSRPSSAISISDIRTIATQLDNIDIALLPFRINQKLGLRKGLNEQSLMDIGKDLLRQARYRLHASNSTSEFPDLYSRIKHHAFERPYEGAISDDSNEVDWHTFHEHIIHVALQLKGLDLQKNECVGLLSENSIQYLEILIGIICAGGCVVPLPSKSTSQTIKVLSTDADIRICYTSKKLKDIIMPMKEAIDHHIAIDFIDSSWIDYPSMEEETDKKDVQVAVHPDDPFDIQYSSGTTGVPKGIIHSRRVRHAQYSKGFSLNYTPWSTALFSTPLYSNTTLVSTLRALAAGSRIILMKKFKIEGLLQICQQEKVSHAVLVPVQLQRIMASPLFGKYDLSNFDLVYSTSAPLKGELKLEIVNKWPGYLVEIYSMTEGGIVSILIANLHPDKLDTVGKPPEGVSVLKILDENDKELPSGEIGEIVGRDPYRMTGYHNRERATQECTWYDSEGLAYQRSGDYGEFDSDGFLKLHGRKKEVIISGGHNVYAIDLEDMLKGHPIVKEAAVIGIPSEKWGETPYALIEISKDNSSNSDTDSHVSPENILDWANERLGKLQRISGLEIRDDLPRSGIGKVLKKELRKHFWDLG